LIATEWETVRSFTSDNMYCCTTFLCLKSTYVKRKLLTVGCFSACKDLCVKKMHTVIIGCFMLLKACLWKESNEVQDSWMQLKTEGWYGPSLFPKYRLYPSIIHMFSALHSALFLLRYEVLQINYQRRTQ